MPYVPSLKTDGKSQDRIIIDKQVEILSNHIISKITRNFDIETVYTNSFEKIATCLLTDKFDENSVESNFAKTIFEVGDYYKYEGAFLGELNYSITRTIQRVPQMLAEKGMCGLVKGKELRYWLYAMTVTALTNVCNKLGKDNSHGISGVFEDIKDEYKVRVNKSYEIAQILKSGDCYDTPYFNKVVEIKNENNKVIGYTYIELVNDGKNVNLDKMPFHLSVNSSKQETISTPQEKEDYL